MLIARKGNVAYCEAFGFQDREKRLPMTTDAIFRIASLIKPIVSAAFMTLVEEGKVRLTAPVSLYLPEFKDFKVGIEKLNSTTGKLELTLEAQVGEMTIQDLLRHTSGISHFLIGTSLVNEAYRSANIAAPNQTLAELVTRLTQLPLAFHPGTTFEYGLSTDVLGRVAEVVSGMSLDEFVAERVTKPLGMSDTAFYITGTQAARLAEPQVDAATGSRPPMRDVINRPKWMSGGAGMVSTVSDYARFCQMFLNGGQLDGVRLLSPKTVAHMTANHLPPGVAMSPTVLSLLGPLIPDAAHGQGFGLGFAVRTEAGPVRPGNIIGLEQAAPSSGSIRWRVLLQ